MKTMVVDEGAVEGSRRYWTINWPLNHRKIWAIGLR